MTPVRSRKPCAYPGCPALIVGATYCDRHRKQRDYRPRSTHPRGGGNSSDWRTIRAAVLARDPVCTICHQAPSTVADHIIAKRMGGLDTMANLRGVCLPCNSRKAATSEGGFGNQRR